MATKARNLLESLNSAEASAIERIQAVYGDDRQEREIQLNRLRYLVEKFIEHFGPDEFLEIYRAPGRVNLIGEHTDYNGLPVMPIAINRDFLCAASPRADGVVHVFNTDRQFPDFMFPATEFPKPSEIGNWSNYVKAGFQGICEDGPRFDIDIKQFKGCNLLFDGNIPSSAGLSSSSALVVVSALALLGAHGKQIAKHELAQILARAEHFVGTQGGGMDQTVSLLGEKDHALKIDFNPFGYSHVPIPPEVRVVVANSLVTAAKTGDARFAYNCRVVECRTAVALLNRGLAERGKVIRMLGDFVPAELGLDEKQLDMLAEKAIPKGPLTAAEIARRLNLPREEFLNVYCRLRTGEILQPPQKGLEVWKRYRHVISEGRRVEMAARALQSGDVEKVGKLMVASHFSCRDDYEISCETLDALVETARDAGALGSRLTGAGFGGCTVSMVRKEQTEELINKFKANYYDDFLACKEPELRKSIENFEQVVFSVQPVEGADRLL